MPMPTHHYLQTALFLIALIGSQHCAAILFDPAEIYSTAGELFYAEIAFHYAQPNDQFEISLADADDLPLAQPPLGSYAPFNFHLRRQRNAPQGQIVITSTAPLHPSELSLVVKIKIGAHTYLQPIQSALPPSPQQQLLATADENPTFIKLQPQPTTTMPTVVATTPVLSLLQPIEDEINSISSTGNPVQ